MAEKTNPAVLRGNFASILTCVQVWCDLSYPQFINQCWCLPHSFVQWTAIAFRMFVLSVSFIIPLPNIILLPFFAILTTAWPMMIKSQHCDIFHFTWYSSGLAERLLAHNAYFKVDTVASSVYIQLLFLVQIFLIMCILCTFWSLGI